MTGESKRTAPKSVESIYRLSSTQEGILFHAIQAGQHQGLYHQQFTCRLRGQIDAKRLKAAWQTVLDRHPGARALFTWEKRDNPLQVVRSRVELPFEERLDSDLVAGGDALEAWLVEDRELGFRLDRAPLMRVLLARDGSKAARLLWSFHHLLLDGWSMRQFLDEVLAEEASLRTGNPTTQVRPRAFEDYIAWLHSQDRSAAQAFWQRALDGFDTPTSLDVARPPRAQRPARRERVRRLPPTATAAVIDGAKASRVTINTLLRAAWARLLGAYADSDDVVFGATVAGRPPDLPGIEHIVGMCIHTVPVRARIDAGQPVGEWLRGLQRAQLEAQPFECTPLVDIQRCTGVPAGTALFETLLVVESHTVDPASGTDGRLAMDELRFVERSNYPLAILALPGTELELLWIYDPHRFDAGFIDRIAEQFEHVLRQIAARSDQPVSAIDPMRADDRELLARWSRPAVAAEEPTRSTVLHRIREVVARRPEHPAVRAADGTLTYDELWQRSHALAHALRVRGVVAGDRVTLSLPRGVAMLVGILGVQLAGAAYVPLDPTWPAARREALAATSGARFAVGRANTDLPILEPVLLTPDGRLHGAETDHTKSEFTDAARPDGLAYVLFTSGSTGTPKGVEITHRNLAASTAARDSFYGDPVERFLLVSPYVFDSSIAGLFWTLATGGTLILPAPDEERDLVRLSQRIRDERVTHTLCLPSLYELLLDSSPDHFGSLRTVIVAGEACPVGLAATHARTLPSAELVNEYGPTEATVWATAYRLPPDLADTRDATPIGRPVDHARAFVLARESKSLVLPGAVGELAVGGAAVARGYAGQAGTDAHRFVTIDLDDDGPQRIYRTGDLVRFDESGVLHFLGRADHQVKLRGHRIELGEVEAKFAQIDAVQEAAIEPKRVRAADSDRVVGLIAYVTLRASTAIPGDALLTEARLNLPDYMVPTQCVVLDQLPRTATGKIDRKALPEPTAPEPERMRAPSDEIEEQLVAIWCEVLGLDQVSTDADFFALGGDSLMSIRIIARAHRAGLAVDPARFVDQPTILGMAALCRTAATDAEWNAQDLTPDGPFALTPIQAWFFELDLPRPEHWNQAAVIELDASIAVDTIQHALDELIERHAALRLRVRTAGTERTQSFGAPTPWPLRVMTGNRSTAEGKAELLAMQTGFDLQAGPLVGAVLFRPPGGDRQHLVLAAHHLAVDVVSWSILFDELAERLRTDPTVATARGLPTRASLAQWVERLQSRAQSPELAAEADYWLGLEAHPAPPLGQPSPDPVHAERSITVQLDATRTQALGGPVHDAYRTQTLDVLLTALAEAMAPVLESNGLVIDLEGHGRDPSLDSPNTLAGNLVGWLTAVWPIHLDCGTDPDPGARLKAIKERLRAVPHGGVGFGVLKTLSPNQELRTRLSALPPRQVLFNFLGTTPGASSSTPTARITFDPQEVGPCRSQLGQRAYPLEINAAIVGDQLQATWSHGPSRVPTETVQAAADRWVHALERLIDHCTSPTAGGATPSDFPLAGLDQAQLDKLSDLLGD